MTGDEAGRSHAFESSPARFYGVICVLLFVEVLGSLEISMIYSALPAIVRQFKDVSSAGWLITAFGLTTAATAAIGGRLGDIFGRRRVLLIVVTLCAVGSLISATASSLGVIILGRAIQGTSGIMLPLSYGITRDLAAPGRAPFWNSILTGGYAVSAAIGYLVGGAFADAGNWHGIFQFTAAVCFVSIPLLWLFVPETKSGGKTGKVDIVGGVLFAPAVASILFGVTRASTLGWGASSAFIGCGVAVLAFWFWYEARRDDPLIDVRLLRRPEIAVANSCAALCAFGSMQLALISLMILQQPIVAGVGLGVSATMAGLLKLPSNASSVIGAPIGGWISSAYGARWAVFLGGLVAAGAYGTFVFLHDSVLQVVIFSIVCGLGNILLLVGLPNMVLERAPNDRSSEVTGLLSVVRGLFSAIGSQTIAILLSTSSILDPRTGAKLPSEAAYRLTFGVIAVSSLLVAVLTLATVHRTARRVETAR
jgi:MFS family permease